MEDHVELEPGGRDPMSDTLSHDAATRIIIYRKDTWKSTVQHARPKSAIRALRSASSPALLKRTTHHAQLFKLHTGTRPTGLRTHFSKWRHSHGSLPDREAQHRCWHLEVRAQVRYGWRTTGRNGQKAATHVVGGGWKDEATRHIWNLCSYGWEVTHGRWARFHYGSWCRWHRNYG